VRLTIREDNAQLKQSALPKSLLLAWYATLPDLQVKYTLRIALGLCVETEGMITSPLLPLLLEAHLTQCHVGCFAQCEVGIATLKEAERNAEGEKM
jgi:hypothetical protein